MRGSAGHPLIPSETARLPLQKPQHLVAAQPSNPNPRAFPRLRKQLLAWYDAHARKLPWRDSGSAGSKHPTFPYRVLVSEAMLQQTQVATVIPYFHRFMEAFPTVDALAAADEQRVLRLWQGLGYYRRARSLHAAAGAIVERFDGRVPDTVEDLLTLPGVGRYTAGAVASIAYGRRAPILDGNVIRVLSRWFLVTQPVSETPTKARLWELAEQVVPNDRPGDFNQAMMELGALVCVPREPKCLVCSVAEQCEANRAGRQSDVPVVAKRAARQRVAHEVVAIRKGGRYLFERRSAKGLWSNMWQLPTREGGRGDLAAWVHESYGLCLGPLTRIGQLQHATTHRDIVFTIFVTDVTGGRLKRGAGEWRTLDAIDDLPLSKPQLRAVAMLRTV